MWVVLEYRPDGVLGFVHGPFESLGAANRWCDQHPKLRTVPWPLLTATWKVAA